MAQTKILVIQYECERCTHKWVPRKSGIPLICPKCKSPYWNRIRKE